MDARRIPPGSLVQQFLDHMRAAGLDGLVVLGGAVRDTFLGRPVHDLDMAVILPKPPPIGPGRVSEGERLVLLPEMRGPLGRLAASLGAESADTLLSGRVAFRGTPVDLLGLLPVRGDDGALYPDIYALPDGRTMRHVPGSLTINGLALDASGRLYREEWLEDLRQRRATFVSPPRVGPRCVYVLCRLVILRTACDLRFDAATAQLIERHLEELAENAEAVERDLRSPATQRVLSRPELREIRPDGSLIRSFQEVFRGLGVIGPLRQKSVVVEDDRTG